MMFIYYDYYYTKQFTAICFTKNVKEYFESDILTNKYLQFLYEKIVDYKEFAIINEQMKYNLLELINFIRFNKTLNNKQIEMINKIIVKINSTKISFYPFQAKTPYLGISDKNLLYYSRGKGVSSSFCANLS